MEKKGKKEKRDCKQFPLQLHSVQATTERVLEMGGEGGVSECVAAGVRWNF